jgi:hypothetical protein
MTLQQVAGEGRGAGGAVTFANQEFPDNLSFLPCWLLYDVYTEYSILLLINHYTLSPPLYLAPFYTLQP